MLTSASLPITHFFLYVPYTFTSSLFQTSSYISFSVAYLAILFFALRPSIVYFFPPDAARLWSYMNSSGYGDVRGDGRVRANFNQACTQCWKCSLRWFPGWLLTLTIRAGYCGSVLGLGQGMRARYDADVPWMWVQ